MRVLVDARSAVEPRRTGIGRYTRALLRYLPPADPESSFVAWYLDVRRIGRPPRRFAGWAPNLTEHATRIPSRAFEPISLRTWFPKVGWLARRSDIVLAANFLPPPTSATGIVMVVHDLAFEVLPETAPHHTGRWRRLFDRSLGTAAAVIVPSDATRGDLLRYDPAVGDRVHVVRHGTDTEAFSPASPPEVEDVRLRYEIGGPYVVFLGGLEPRKNVESLILAMGMIEDTHVSLVVAGGPVPWAPEYAGQVDRTIAALPSRVRARIVRTGYIPDADRRALLSGAEVLAYPSRYEGFGFPILEGFAANVPVLTSNIGSMPEVAGNAAILVDPEDPEAIARGVDELLGDDDLRNVLRAAGTARVASFTWERSARETAAVLRQAHHGDRAAA